MVAKRKEIEFAKRNCMTLRAINSVARVSALHAESRGFKSLIAHCWLNEEVGGTPNSLKDIKCP